MKIFTFSQKEEKLVKQGAVKRLYISFEKIQYFSNYTNPLYKSSINYKTVCTAFYNNLIQFLETFLNTQNSIINYN